MKLFHTKKTERRWDRRMRGFSLIEMLVAVSLFTFVSLISVSTIVATSKLNQRLVHAKTIYDNLNLVLDDMSRSLRQGYDFRSIPNSQLPEQGVDSNQTITFVPNDYQRLGGEQQDAYYRVVENGIGVIKKTSYLVSSTSTFPWMLEGPAIGIQRLTSDEVDIMEFTINIEGQCRSFTSQPPAESYLPPCDTNTDMQQPIAHIIITGETTGAVKIPFHVETAVNQYYQDR